MKKLDAHSKLIAMLGLLLVAAAGPAILTACSGLFPHGLGGSEATEAFDRIVPGMTRAEDLPALGFDTAHTDLLSAREVKARLASDAAVTACVQAGIYCTGMVFHPAHAAKVTLLVMNGRVMHKVLDKVRAS
jgi:hypothetical protein